MIYCWINGSFHYLVYTDLIVCKCNFQQFRRNAQHHTIIINCAHLSQLDILSIQSRLERFSFQSAN